MCGAAQVSRVAYEVPVGLREHPRRKRRGLRRGVGRAGRHSGELGQWTAMYSADELDLGMGTLSSRRPCRCISIASCILRVA